MYHDHLEPQAAVDRAVQMLHQCYERYHKAEAILFDEVDSQTLDTLKTCVQAYKDIVMCNLHWR